MKINRFKSFCLLPALFMGMTLAGCSNSEDIVDGQTQEGMGSVSFTIKEKNYEPVEEVAGTRAAAPEQPEIQDLGDGWMAEVSLVPDTTHAAEPKAKTRAINTPTHYTIQAYQGNVKKGELKGTFNGSDFTPDAGQGKSIILPHGTYDFVCFNDKVSANGTQFTLNRADAGTARFTVKRGVVINQDPKQFVEFEMKHAGVKITHWVNFINCPFKGVITGRVGIYMSSTLNWYEPANPSEKLKYTIDTAPNKIPETEVYDLVTNGYTYPTMGQISQPVDVKGTFIGSMVDNISVGDNTGIYNNNSTDYVLPMTDCAEYKLTFTFGELYGKSLVGKTITVATHKLVEANKSYRIVIGLFMKDRMYLFNDGTAGLLSQNPGKTPVGVVVEPYKRIAVALKDADNGGTSPIWSSSPGRESQNPATDYDNVFGTNFLPYYSPTTVEQSPSSSPARQLALDYYQTVGYGNSVYITGNGRPKRTWYIPTTAEFLNTGVSFGKMHNPNASLSSQLLGNFYYFIPDNAPTTGFTGVSLNIPQMDMVSFNKAFTDVGGTAPTGTYWTDIECQDGSNYKQAQISVNSTGFGLGLGDKTIPAKVRPFIRY